MPRFVNLGELQLAIINLKKMIQAAAASGDMLKSVYDTDSDGVVDAAETVALAADSDKVDGEHASAFADASHAHAGTDITSGILDGDRLPALSATKRGGVKPTGTPSGNFLKDDDTWATPPGGGDMLKSVYDTDNDGVVDAAETAVVAADSDKVDGKHASDFLGGDYDVDYRCLLVVK